MVPPRSRKASALGLADPPFHKHGYPFDPTGCRLARRPEHPVPRKKGDSRPAGHLPGHGQSLGNPWRARGQKSLCGLLGGHLAQRDWVKIGCGTSLRLCRPCAGPLRLARTLNPATSLQTRHPWGRY